MSKIISSPIIGDRKISINMLNNEAVNADEVDEFSILSAEQGPTEPSSITNSYTDEEYEALVQDLAAAQATIEQLNNALQEVVNEKDDIYQAARLEGFEKGCDEGRKSIEDDYVEKQLTINSLLESIELEKRQYLDNIEDEVVEVVFNAVAKIVGNHVKTKKGVKDIITAQLHNISDINEMTLMVSPGDLQTVQDMTDPVMQNIKLAGDNLISRGGCILKSDKGSLDARLEVQMDIFKEVLSTVYKSRTKSK